MSKELIIKIITDLMLPLAIAVTFKGLTAIITFIGVFFYCLNQIAIFRQMLAEKYKGSVRNYFRNKLKR